MTASLKNLTIRQAAAACLFMAFLAGLLLVILKHEELLPSDFAIHAALFMLFMLFIGIGTVGTLGVLLWLAPERVLGIPWFIILLWLLWVTDGQLFPGIDAEPGSIIPGFIAFVWILWRLDGQLYPS